MGRCIKLGFDPERLGFKTKRVDALNNEVTLTGVMRRVKAFAVTTDYHNVHLNQSDGSLLNW